MKYLPSFCLLLALSQSVAASPLLLQAGTCDPSWLPAAGGIRGASARVRAMERFDDGTGEALYVGGSFDVLGGTVARFIGKWDGIQWSALSGNLNNFVHDLAVFDDGTGPALYVAGEFTLAGGVPANGIAKWDGTSWTPLGLGVNGTGLTLEVFDDGGGSALYLGGEFTTAGGGPASAIAKWDGATWSSLGSGMTGVTSTQPATVLDMHAFDDGTGEALYVGGLYAAAGGLTATGLARWNGSSWSTVGPWSNIASNAAAQRPTVRSMVTYDDGGGPDLYVAGAFFLSGTPAGRHVARWDGTSFTAVSVDLTGPVYDLQVFDEGNGPTLFAAGNFLEFGFFYGPPIINNLARLDGGAWTQVGGGMTKLVEVLEVFDDGTGERLYAGGQFRLAGSTFAERIASWDGTSFKPLISGSQGPTGVIGASTTFDDGSGEALYLGMDVTRVPGGGGVDRSVACWDGSSLTTLGLPRSGELHALTSFDDGNGEALYCAGFFPQNLGADLHAVLQWDGAAWIVPGGGIRGTGRAAVVFDDGTGEALYVSGSISIAGSGLNTGVIKWDGTNWSTVGSGTSDSPYALAVFDDGTGPALYAGGKFTLPGSTTSLLVAKWDGMNWTPVGVDSGGSTNMVHSLTTFDDGNGEELYAGGALLTIAGTPVLNIAKWDGMSWSAVGSGTNSEVQTLAVFDGGTGEALFAGGSFTSAGGVPANRVARWDGSAWSTMGFGVNRSVETLSVFDDGNGPALYLGGSFTSAFETGDSYLAKWGCETPPRYEDFCNGDGGNQLGCTECPCSNNASPGTVGGCINGSLLSARLLPSGEPSLANDTMRFDLSGGSPSAFAILSSGASRAPTNAMNPCFGFDSGLSSSQFDGLRCAVQSVQRHGTRLLDIDGSAGATSSGWGGPFAPLSGLIAQGGFAAGQTRHYQAVYRDDIKLGCMSGLNTSQGVTVTFQP